MACGLSVLTGVQNEPLKNGPLQHADHFELKIIQDPADLIKTIYPSLNYLKNADRNPGPEGETAFYLKNLSVCQDKQLTTKQLITCSFFCPMKTPGPYPSS